MTNADWCKENNVSFVNLNARESTDGVWEIISNDSAHYGVIGDIVKNNSNETAFHAFRRWLDASSLHSILTKKERELLSVITSGLCVEDSRLNLTIIKSSSMYNRCVRNIIIKVYNCDDLINSFVIPLNIKTIPLENMQVDRIYTPEELGL